jgi:hypothetical protein
MRGRSFLRSNDTPNAHRNRKYFPLTYRWKSKQKDKRSVVSVEKAIQNAGKAPGIQRLSR